MSEENEVRLRCRKDGEGGSVTSWFMRREITATGAIAVPLRSDNLAPVKLPEGIEASICRLFSRLPGKR
jgi:hypothetical protein